MNTVEATYFTTSDSRYFPGTVALVNSLRLTGNRGGVVVFDLGLTDDQRHRLSTIATVQAPASPRDFSPKVLPSSAATSGAIVVIDSDMLVVASLGELLQEAERGRIVLFPDPDKRWFEEWSVGFALQAPLRHERYANSGFVAFSAGHWPQLLERWTEANSRLPRERSTRAEDPFRDVDQDALNAVLMSEFPAGAVLMQPDWAQAHPDALLRVEVVDEHDLTCTDGPHRVTILHHSLVPKGWDRLGWQRDFRQAYLRLLPRVLFASDVPLRLETDEVPLWLRPTVPGRIALRALTVGHATPSAKGAAKALTRAGRAVRRRA
jgi:hypothetical protein